MKSRLAEASFPGPSSDRKQATADLSIIVVSYNVRQFLEQTLLSVQRACRGLNAEIIVVENNDSADGSIDMVKSRFPDYKVIDNKENLGFSKANNQGIRMSNSPFVLLLNPDTVVQESTFTVCLDYMAKHPEVGALGVKMLDGAGRFLPESKRGLPTPKAALYKMLGLSKLFPKSETFSKYHLNHLDKNQNHKVEVLSGAFMFLRKDALDKSGLLDETFFMYGEDIDLSYRITLAGYENHYIADTSIIHYKGESTKKASFNYVYHFYNAMAIFARKHYSTGHARWMSLFIQIAIYAKAGLAATGRLLSAIKLPMFDMGLIYVLLAGFSMLWESTLKAEATLFPAQMWYLILPIYVVIWSLTGRFVGAYDKPYRAPLLLFGSMMGTLVISAMVNFIEPLRMSKAVILMGFPLVMTAWITTRLAQQWILHKRFSFSDAISKRILVVGSESSTDLVKNLLSKLRTKHELLGYVWKGAGSGVDGYLGHLDNLVETCRIYRAEEVIFAGADLETEDIMNFITHFPKDSPEFKIFPSNADYIIGSHSRNANGDYYMADIDLEFEKPINQRLKRSFELIVCVPALLLYPLYAIFIKSPGRLLRDLVGVVIGQKYLVGPEKKYYPKMLRKASLFTPSSTAYSDQTNHQLTRLYLRNFSIQEEIRLFWQNFFGKKE